MTHDLIVAAYAPARYRPTLQTVAMLAEVLPLRRIVLVLNGSAIGGAEDASDRLGRAVETIRHDNVGREFGAYQAGLDHCRADLADGVVIVNDTLGSHQPVTRPWLKAFVDVLSRNADPGFVAGTLQISERRMELDGMTSSRWIRSNLIGLDRAALDALDHRIFVPKVEDFVRTTDDVDRFFTPDVGPALAAHLRSWLFSSEGLRWYGAQPLTSDNAARMAEKARSILQEKHLSCRLDTAGMAFRGITFTRRSDRVLHKFGTLEIGRRLRLGGSAKVGHS